MGFLLSIWFCLNIISAKEETHILFLEIDSYTYFIVNAILIVLLIHQQKRWKYFKTAALIYVLIVTGSINYMGALFCQQFPDNYP